MYVCVCISLAVSFSFFLHTPFASPTPDQEGSGTAAGAGVCLFAWGKQRPLLFVVVVPAAACTMFVGKLFRLTSCHKHTIALLGVGSKRKVVNSQLLIGKS